MKPSKVKAYEKRLDVRIPIQLKVDIETDHQHYLFEYSTNLSQSGIFIHTEDPLDPGSIVQIHFALPEGLDVRTLGEVIWANFDDDEEPGMGIRFVGLNEKDKDKILSAIKKLAIL